MRFWKSDSFRALQLDWYRRLEESGFQDQEVLIGSELVLKQSVERYALVDDEAQWERAKITAQYYRLILENVLCTKFSKPLDEFIMTCHGHGWKICQIVEALKSVGVKRRRTSIRYRIRVYLQRWGIRTYSRRQLNLKAS